ncbi:MAG: RlpA-like double-psi beta-barrel domain-containing protein [bacterium]
MSRFKKIKIIIRFILLIILCYSIFYVSLAADLDISNAVFSIKIDQKTIERGYEIKGFGGDFQIAVFPFVLKSPARIELKNRTEIARVEDAGKFAAAVNEDIGVRSDISTTSVSSLFNENLSSATDNSMESNGSREANRVSTTTVDIIASSTKEIEKRATLIGENPDGWEIASDIYEFDVMDKNAFDGKKPFIVSIRYDDDGSENKTENRKKIFYYDSALNEWIGLPSTIMYDDKLVRAVIQLPYAKLAVFENKNVLSVGEASWYKYKGCNCVASPDYSKGTKLKVTNLYNDKSVIVEVNDYGPERDIFPDRVIDLDLEAFTKIAKKGAGVINVKVEPVNEICSYAFQKARHPSAPAPQISAKAAIVIDEPTGEVLFAKNEKEKRSIASITKLMTASVFMDLNPPLPPLVKGGKLEESAKGENIESWNKIIKYNKADDLDGAKLYVNDGETMKIKDIFYSMLVGSANNAAKTLAKNSGVAYPDFIVEMNKKAKEWHLENTEFREPTGLDPRNISTAFDMAIMAKNIFKNLEMLKATTLEKYSFRTLNTNIAHTISSTNKLLSDKDLYITGAKTGFLNEAGHCLVIKAKNKNDGREVIGVVLGEKSSEDRFEDMKNLIKWALEDYN